MKSLLFAGLLASATVWADTSTQRLQEFLNGLRSLDGYFTQTVVDANGKVTYKASGQLVVQRPGKFRWDYKLPYKQLILSDGKRIWFYDTDLEQITVKPLDETIQGTPAMLLSSAQPVDSEFTVRELEDRDGLQWVALSPKKPDSNFDVVRLGFKRSTLKRMEMVDSFEQTTILDFDRLQRNRSVDPGIFKFVPPAGVDVVGQ